MAESKDTSTPKEVKIVTTVRTDVVDSGTPTTEETGGKKTEKKTTKKSGSKSKKTDNNGKWWEKLFLPVSILGAAAILCWCRNCKGGKGCADCGCQDDPQQPDTVYVEKPQTPVIDSTKTAMFNAVGNINTGGGDIGQVIVQQTYANDHSHAESNVESQTAVRSQGTQNQRSGGDVQPVVRKPKPVVIEVPGDTIVVRKPVVVEEPVPTPAPKPECTTEINVTKAWSLCSDAASFTAAYYGIKVH